MAERLREVPKRELRSSDAIGESLYQLQPTKISHGFEPVRDFRVNKLSISVHAGESIMRFSKLIVPLKYSLARSARSEAKIVALNTSEVLSGAEDEHSALSCVN